MQFIFRFQGPRLQRKYHVKSFFTSARSLETSVDGPLYSSVKTGLVDLLGGRTYFASWVLTPYCYTLGKVLYLGVHMLTRTDSYTTEHLQLE
uniref:FAST kinase-like protein subdomain 2 domain-containing protein n=1 Tax=Anguilla anguilla TaxID=7936 RepID=A0A0E9WT25_ANGAN